MSSIFGLDLHICWNTVGCLLCSSDKLGVSLVLRGSGLHSHLSCRHLPIYFNVFFISVITFFFHFWLVLYCMFNFFFWSALSVLLLSSLVLSILMSISLNFLSGKVLTSLSLRFYSRVLLLFSFIWGIFFFPLILFDFLCRSYGFNGMANSPSIKNVVSV